MTSANDLEYLSAAANSILSYPSSNFSQIMAAYWARIAARETQINEQLGYTVMGLLIIGYNFGFRRVSPNTFQVIFPGNYTLTIWTQCDKYAAIQHQVQNSLITEEKLAQTTVEFDQLDDSPIKYFHFWCLWRGKECNTVDELGNYSPVKLSYKSKNKYNANNKIMSLILEINEATAKQSPMKW